MARATEPRSKTSNFIQDGLPNDTHYTGPLTMKRVYDRVDGQFKAIGWMTTGYTIQYELRHGHARNIGTASHDVVVLDTDL